MTTPLISVVIPTLNRRDTLQHVLPRLANQSLSVEQYELLLCDSGSTDATHELVESLKIPNLIHLDTGGDRGRSGARNVGIKAARGIIVLFTDADILPAPDLLEVHVKAHEQNPNSAIRGLEVQVDSLEEYFSVQAQPLSGRHLHSSKEKILSWLFYLTGNASVSRAKLIEVGMFDENFTGYGHEDIELGYRLQKAGLTLRYYPQAINFHMHPVAFDEQCSKIAQSGAATYRFFAKYNDLTILLRLGVNPLSLGGHALLKSCPALLSYLEKQSSQSRTARSLLLQYHYISGYKAARK